MSREYVVMQTFTAGEDFTDPNPDGDAARLGDLYKPVKLNANGHVVKATADTDLAIGVIHYCVPQGEPTQVAIGGVSPVQVAIGGDHNAGTVLTPSDGTHDNRAIPFAANKKGFAKLIEKVGVADDECAVKAMILPQLA